MPDRATEHRGGRKTHMGSCRQQAWAELGTLKQRLPYLPQRHFTWPRRQQPWLTQPPQSKTLCREQLLHMFPRLLRLRERSQVRTKCHEQHGRRQTKHERLHKMGDTNARWRLWILVNITICKTECKMICEWTAMENQSNMHIIL